MDIGMLPKSLPFAPVEIPVDHVVDLYDLLLGGKAGGFRNGFSNGIYKSDLFEPEPVNG
jgi:hypothetical protein